MLFSKCLFDKAMAQLQVTHQRVNDKLNRITSLIRSSEKFHYQFVQCQACIQKYLCKAKNQAQQADCFLALKLAMLAHNLILQQYQRMQRGQMSQKIVQLVNNTLNAVFRIQCRTKWEGRCCDKEYIKKTISDYVLYLMKKSLRLQMGAEQGSYFKNAQSCPESSQQSSENSRCQHDADGDRWRWAQLELHYHQCYIHLNLINTCTKISDRLVGMIRYDGGEHQFLIDFNVLLASDLRPIYDKLAVSYHSIKSIENCSHMESTEFQQLTKQIQKCHEKLFLIFMNRYHYAYISKYNPAWIQTASQTVIQQKDSQTRSLNTNHDTSSESVSNVFESILLSNRQIQQFQWTDKYSYQTIQTSRQIQMLTLLQDLTSALKKSLSAEQSIKLCKKTRSKKSKSFYQTKPIYSKQKI